MNRRRGVTLIETVSAVTAGSVIVGISAGLLCMLFRTQSVSRDHVHQGTVLSQLGAQFRQDVRAATAVNGGDEASWQFDLTPQRTVSYRAEADAIVRVVTVDRKVLRREQFSLPSGTAGSIRIEEESSPRIVSLVVASPPPSQGAPSQGAPSQGAPPTRIVRFDALLAADHRFLPPGESPDDSAEPSSEDSDG